MTDLAQREVALRIYPPTLGVVAQAAVLVLLGVTVSLGVAGWFVGLGYSVVTWVLLSRALQQPDVHQWGPADTVTFGRLILTGGVAALVADSVGGGVYRPALIGLAALSLILDAVDGQVARRTGTASRFGARFDMEADSVLAIVLSVFIATSLGWWAAAIGLFRYTFVLASWAMPWLCAPLLPRVSRKVVAASQGVVLVVVSAGLLPVQMAQVCVALSIGSLVWSFGIDVAYLWRQSAARKRLTRFSTAELEFVLR
ncbi:CDP-alcohol phosphatidyltransferase family protein [Streptomyces sp. NPDC060223]|uniref:CDP-alcohol phosphatidyltransferase family protein n=1 Tax=unclassified Streptomyces TaxID=2593676 RepID=UPI003631C762